MKRVMLWANYKSKGKLQSFPVVEGDGCLVADFPEDAELVSVIAASGVWVDDDGNFVDTLEDPDTKKARAGQRAVINEQKAKEDSAKEARKAKALALAAKGMTPRAIADVVGTTTWVVNLWIRMHKAGR